MSRLNKQDKFRYRGNEIFRIEALSDAVFAFSVSLLAASLEVPQTFHELKMITKGSIPFFFHGNIDFSILVPSVYFLPPVWT